MKKKNVLGLVLAMSMMALVACGGSDDKAETKPEEKEEETVEEKDSEDETEAETEEAEAEPEEAEDPEAGRYDTYEIHPEAFEGYLTFEFANDLGYELEPGATSNQALLTNEEDGSTIQIFVANTKKSDIVESESNFGGDYHDHQLIEVAGHEAFTIEYGDNFRIHYGILMDEYDPDNFKCHGVKLQISRDGADVDGKFDPRAFCESEEFQHFLESLVYVY